MASMRPMIFDRSCRSFRPLKAAETNAIARLVDGGGAGIKRYLDLGVQTLLIPMVDTAEQAEELAACVRYPPRGMRGLATSITRASRWAQIENLRQRGPMPRPA